MGFGLFWKERGPTSNEKLADIKRSLGIGGPLRKDIGHGGTLDPFAEGWLIVGWGEGTKFLGALKNLSKTYVAEILLGATTPTFDDTVPLEEWDPPFEFEENLAPLEEKLRGYLQTKRGLQMQKPPLYSAKKVDGRASYELIRKGVVADLKEVSVEIFEAEHLKLESVDSQHLKWTVKVRVSAGTYIRCLARDWSTELFGKPALLTKLARIGYGNFEESLAREQKIVKNLEQMTEFFHLNSELKNPEPLVSNKGHILVGENGNAQAAWLCDSSRWRYFTADPLG
jgi:tRNA pseudouridine55 synthase